MYFSTAKLMQTRTDSRTACTWQSMAGKWYTSIIEVHHSYMFTGSQALMQSSFKAAMLKLSLLGQDQSKMVDCSDVIPVPASVTTSPHLPAGMTQNDIEQAVRT